MFYDPAFPALVFAIEANAKRGRRKKAHPSIQKIQQVHSIHYYFKII